MTRQEEIKEEVKSIFSEDMLLCFWTHERCPPTQQEFKQCQLDSDIKHERCMPCWEKWVDGLVDKVLKKEHELGVVIKAEGELPEITEELRQGAHCGQFFDEQWYYAGQGEMEEAGYVAVEPLIGEK